MRENTQPPASKLKRRPAGTPSADLDHHRENENKRRHRNKGRNWSKRSTRHRGSNPLFSIFRGLLTIAAITAAMYWTVKLPFSFTAKSSNQDGAAVETKSAEATEQPVIENVASNAGEENGDAATEQVQPVPATSATDDIASTGEVASTTEDAVNTIAAEPATETSVSQTDDTGDIRVEKLPGTATTTTPQVAETIDATVDDTSAATSTAAENNTSASDTTEGSDDETTVTIKTYRATMFSTLADGAKETTVPHGAKVKLLKRNGEWVRIQILESGAIGFIHISQLNT